MQPDGRIVVMHPDAVASATVIGPSTPVEPGKTAIAGHDLLVFFARGEGHYRTGSHAGALQANTLLTVPAGAFSCESTPDREMYVLAVRRRTSDPDAPDVFMPALERRLSPLEGRRWTDVMGQYAYLAAGGRLTHDHIDRLEHEIAPLFWDRKSEAAVELVHVLSAYLWAHLAEPLTLGTLAREVGYTPNYLNDLWHAHTGRSLGRWIADMRMARARAYLELTDLPVAEVGVRCGYEDPAYFSRAFRRAHAVPPATWRIAARPIDHRHRDVTISVDVFHEQQFAAASRQRTVHVA